MGSSSFDLTSFLSGGIAGIVQTLVGHPFDTAKTIIQSRGRQEIIRNFIQTPGIWYSGAFYPLISAIVLNSFIFGIQRNIMEKLRFDGGVDANSGGANNIVYRSAISGGITGTIVSIFTVPFENWKIQSQSDVCRQFLKENGFIKSAFHGTGITMMRESSAMFIYFGTYDYLRTYMNYGPFFSGLCSGIANWGVTYPIDTIKSRIQSYKYTGIYEAIRAGGLWNGISIVLLRAGLVNGSIFYTYENVKNMGFGK
jgi:solute carrier family 25 carnitine/acylcarnitine transporter 20/29